MGKIVTFGEILLRLAPDGNNRLFQSNQFSVGFGGAEANVAVSLANFGECVSFVTKLPNHVIGQGAINNLRYFGVDTSFISRGGDRVGIYYLEKGANQRGSVCIYDRTGSSFATAQPEDFDWNDIFYGVDWFHFTGITPALGENIFNICKQACIAAKKRNVRISCDLNYRSKLWTQKDAESSMAELCSYVDVCIANEEDTFNVFGIKSADTNVFTGKINKKGYEDVAKKLCDKFDFSYVAFTFRKSYSAFVNDWSGMLFDKNDFFYSQEYHIDHVVDRVGGGDSFGAGLIFGLINNFASQRVIDFAAACSALKHSVEGDFNRTSIEEVEFLIEGNASGRIQR